MFEYEREVRIVLAKEELEAVPGHAIDWDPSSQVDAVFIHPEADEAFFQAAVGIIDQYAPALRPRTQWSAMRERPPLGQLQHPRTESKCYLRMTAMLS
jgi:hypothetical protein